jgi:hypothetical protein
LFLGADSKAVLAVMLLRQAGLDATILCSDPLSHAGWPLGMSPPQHDKPHLWKVLPASELPGPQVDDVE